MNASSQDDCFGIGEFLAYHKPGPHIERTDTIEYHDFDVRQDAAYRCIAAFHKNGVAVCDETLLDTLTTYRHAAARNLQNARIDAVRRLRGRGSQRGKDKRVSTVAHVSNSEFVWISDADRMGVEDCAPCPHAEQALDEVECDFYGELERVYANATPTEQKTIRVLAEWQRRKDCGENWYPLRKTIHKLKAKLKAEGSSFDINPRYL